MPRSAPVPSDDAALLRGVAARDAAALSALYERHAPRVYGIALRVTGSPEDAQEAVLDVFCQIWGSAATYDARQGTPDGWIMMLARSRAHDRVRARPRTAPGQTDPASPMPEALSHLTPAQRRVLELAYFDGLTHAAIAQCLGETLGTIAARARAGLLALRAALAATASAPRR